VHRLPTTRTYLDALIALLESPLPSSHFKNITDRSWPESCQWRRRLRAGNRDFVQKLAK
jgi:hypothetical protein